MKRISPVVVLLAGCLVAPASFAQPAQQGATQKQMQSAGTAEQARATTIENLQSASRGEANAANRYDLFARRADEDGYDQVARLFRAAALSERIHLRNHQAVLRKLGEQPQTVSLEPVEVQNTRQNLLQPIQGEKGEASQMYPNYARIAREAGLASAALTFTYAGETELKHEELFKEALQKLGSNPEADYLVQSESGMLFVQTPARVASVTAPSQG